MKRSTLAALAGLLGYGIFGFSFLFSKMALALTTPFILLSIRFLAAFLVLNLLVLTGKARLNLRGKPVRPLLLLGLVQPVIYFICENYGIAMTSSAFSGIMLGIVPVIGLALGRLVLREHHSRLQVVCAVLSVAGVALTTVGGTGTISLLGTLLLAGAAVSAALFNTISRGISGRFTAFERTYVMFALGSGAFSLMALAENRRDLSALFLPLSRAEFWAAVVYLAVISSVCAFLLINFALSEISVAKASIFSNFTTVISVLAGIFIMKDHFSPVQLTGVVIITLSVFGVSYQKDAAPAQAPEN
ncbi:DMT family transporter [Dysosmobacter sp.]